MKSFKQFIIENIDVTTNKGLQIKIIKTNIGNSNNFRLEAIIDDKPVAQVLFFKNDDGSWSGEDLVVKSKYQHFGIATALYNYVKDKLKIKITPSKIQSQEGEKFWKSLK